MRIPINSGITREWAWAADRERKRAAMLKTMVLELFGSAPKGRGAGKWIFRDAEPILSEKFLLRGNSLQPERNYPIWQF